VSNPTDLTRKYAAMNLDPFKARSVMHVNHRPHPYTVGSQHVVHAHKHCGGVLGEETMRAVRCAHPGCRAVYDEHVADLVLFLDTARDCSNKEANDALLAIKGQLEADGIDGVAFVAGVFKIAEPEGK
jgi:hypothetical protein